MNINDELEEIPVDIDDETFMILSQKAHERDITLNQLMNEILLSQIARDCREREEKVIRKLESIAYGINRHSIYGVSDIMRHIAKEALDILGHEHDDGDTDEDIFNTYQDNL